MVSLVIETWRYFQSHDGRLLSGAIAFYASRAIAPLGVVALLIASLVMTEAQARGELIKQLSGFLGPDLASYVTNTIVELGSKAVESVAAPVIGVLFMFYISTRLFSMLRRALNHMWGIRPKLISKASHPEMFHLMRRRMLAFAMVLIFGSSLIGLVLLHSAVSVAANLIGNSHYALTLAQFASAFGVLVPLIALVYRWLPDATIAWRDVWIGATATCVFVLLGSFLIGIYMGYASPASVYGAAGSLIVLLLWIYYTAQIFLLGAVFTRVWARHRGRAIEPLPYADVVETRGSANESASET
jgi:membrane protein